MNLDVLDFVARGKFIYMLTNPHALLLTLEDAGGCRGGFACYALGPQSLQNRVS